MKSDNLQNFVEKKSYQYRDLVLRPTSHTHQLTSSSAKRSCSRKSASRSNESCRSRSNCCGSSCDPPLVSDARDTFCFTQTITINTSCLLDWISGHL